MKLTKDQQLFWNILRTPYKKDCSTCKHNKGAPGRHPAGEKCNILNYRCVWINPNNPNQYPSQWKWQYESE